MCQPLPGDVSAAGSSAMPCCGDPDAQAEANGARSMVSISGAEPAAATYLAVEVAFLQSTAGGASVLPSASSLMVAVTKQACTVAVSAARLPSSGPAIGTCSVPLVRAVPGGS